MNILFIAENANTRCDFYEANTSLFKVVKQAFEEQFTREFSNEEFLLFFFCIRLYARAFVCKNHH